MADQPVIFEGSEGPVKLELPDFVEPVTVRPAPVAALDRPTERLRECLAQWERSVEQHCRPLKAGVPTALVVSDAFRKTGLHCYLPELLDWLECRGITAELLSVLFASGAHRPPTAEEMQTILGGTVWEKLSRSVFTHDPADKAGLAYLGATVRGTPIWINRRLVACENVIVTGTVVPHYFAGFGGGVKSIVPGLAGLETIAANHSLTLDPEADRIHPAVRIGCIQGNPVAEDLREAAAAVPVTLLVNTVMTPDNRSVAMLWAGHAETAHAEACEWVRRHYMPEISARADIVLASAGPAANFLQSHKALYNAWLACKPDGVVVLDAPCPEGLGGTRFDRWLALGSVGEVARHLRKNPEINGQTALSTLSKAPRTILVSTGLDAQTGKLLGMARANTISEGLKMAVDRLQAEKGNRKLRLVLLPEAYCCVPRLTSPVYQAEECMPHE